MIYRFDAGALPNGREHFGFRDGIGEPHVIGSTDRPRPGQDAVMPGEFIHGYEDELGNVSAGPTPSVLARNGTYLALRQLHDDAAAFVAISGTTPVHPGRGALAAKTVGRWRSGAPLALSPEHDDHELAADPQRNNDFRYYDDDLNGLRVPLGCHIRRINPRDSLQDSIVSINLHRVLRRSAAYGPMLPDGVLEDDGAERGLFFSFMGASLARQFEFVQQVWVNDGDFVGLGNEKDPLAGDNDGTGTYTIPAKPLRRRLSALPRFVTVRGGEYFYLPGIAAMTWLTTLTRPTPVTVPCITEPASEKATTVSDHLSSPRALRDPTIDLTDLYFFPVPDVPGRLAVVVNVFPLAQPGALFSDAVTYRLRLAPAETGADRVIRARPSRPGDPRCDVRRSRS